MSYEPTNWKAGDIVTSAKLNKLEQGIANSGIVEMTIEVNNNNNTITFTLNKTWQEIWDNNYTTVRADSNEYGKSFYSIEGIDAIYHRVYIFNHDDEIARQLQASSANDYPTYVFTQQS